MEYEIIRSKRKTVAIEVKRDGSVVVRAPWLVSRRKIDEFVTKKRDWIEKTVKKVTSKQTADCDIDALTTAAREYLPRRVLYYASVLGVRYGRVTVRHQKTRWGSCSAKGNLNFNCMLMLAPSPVIDYVVVHELCHLKQMNHSPAFWAEVEKILPDYKQLRKQLKDIPL